MQTICKRWPFKYGTTWKTKEIDDVPVALTVVSCKNWCYFRFPFNFSMEHINLWDSRWSTCEYTSLSIFRMKNHTCSSLSTSFASLLWFSGKWLALGKSACVVYELTMETHAISLNTYPDKECKITLPNLSKLLASL